MPSHRHERAASTLQRELSRILLEEVRDPAVAAVRVCSVSLSPDKRSAKVLVSGWVPNSGIESDQRPLRALGRATPFIRRTLAKRLRMRRVPELRFDYDLSDQRSRRIDKLLERIKKRPAKGLKDLTMLLLAVALPLGLSRDALALERLESSASIMGSEFRVACYAPSRKAAAGAITAAFDEARRVDSLLSHYKPDSELSRINREAGSKAVAVSEEMSDLLAACVEYSAATEGAFDVTVGSIVHAWGYFRGDGRKPWPWTLWWARRNSGYRHLELNRSDGTVRFRKAAMRLDPGAIGKGYAVDRVVGVLKEFGVRAAFVSSGTSSIYAMGSPPDRDGWGVDIRAPEAAGEAASVRLSDEAISTSGSYERFFESDGTRYSHILDPRTGRPATGVEAVSVIGPRTIDTEAWSTALYVNGPAWAREHPLPQSRVYLCRAGGGCGWLYGN